MRRTLWIVFFAIGRLCQADPIKIGLDTGHGEGDPGAVVTKRVNGQEVTIKEAEIVKKVTDQIKIKLSAHPSDFTVVEINRKSPEAEDGAPRIFDAKAKDHDILVSIHADSFPGANKSLVMHGERSVFGVGFFADESMSKDGLNTGKSRWINKKGDIFIQFKTKQRKDVEPTKDAVDRFGPKPKAQSVPPGNLFNIGNYNDITRTTPATVDAPPPSVPPREVKNLVRFKFVRKSEQENNLAYTTSQVTQLFAQNSTFNVNETRGKFVAGVDPNKDGPGYVVVRSPKQGQVTTKYAELMKGAVSRDQYRTAGIPDRLNVAGDPKVTSSWELFGKHYSLPHNNDKWFEDATSKERPSVILEIGNIQSKAGFDLMRDDANLIKIGNAISDHIVAKKADLASLIQEAGDSTKLNYPDTSIQETKIEFNLDTTPPENSFLEIKKDYR